MRLPPQTEIGGTTEWIRNLGPSGGENRMNRSMRSSAEWLQEIEISFLTLSLSLSFSQPSHESGPAFKVEGRIAYAAGVSRPLGGAAHVA